MLTRFERILGRSTHFKFNALSTIHRKIKNIKKLSAREIRVHSYARQK